MGAGGLAFGAGDHCAAFTDCGAVPARYLITFTPAGFEREFARRVAHKEGVEPPDWALQEIPHVTMLGPPIGAAWSSRTADPGALRRAIAGDVLLRPRPAMSRAPAAIARFHDLRPHVIVRCAAPADVAAGARVRAARRAACRGPQRRPLLRRPLVDDGLVLDVGPMNGRRSRTARSPSAPGRGSATSTTRSTPTAATIAAGCGPTVGIAGLDARRRPRASSAAGTG